MEDKNKTKVLKKFPKAVAKQWADGWYIERDGMNAVASVAPLSSRAVSERAAWFDAARKVAKA